MTRELYDRELKHAQMIASKLADQIADLATSLMATPTAEEALEIARKLKVHAEYLEASFKAP